MKSDRSICRIPRPDSNLGFMSAAAKLHEHSLFYDPSCTVVEVDHGVKIYRANNFTPKQARQFKLNRASGETGPEYVPILVRSNLNWLHPWPECAARR